MPKYGFSLIYSFPYLDRTGISVLTSETADMILSKYGEIWTRESPYFGIFHIVKSL